jgi:hypothetical protein
MKPWREYRLPSSKLSRAPAALFSLFTLLEQGISSERAFQRHEHVQEKYMCATSMDGYVRSDSDASALFEADNRTFNFVSS